MPAQWPTFINTVSSKLISRSLSADRANDEVQQYTLEIAELFANEYHKAVKTSQTPFGNIHQPGSKSILEAGFKQAFGKLFESLEPQLEDKFDDPDYSDISEGLPVPDYSYDPLCEIEYWALENKDRLQKFQFYQLFPSTCPVLEEGKELGELTFENTTPINIEEESNIAEKNAIYATMSITGFDDEVAYLFRYSINGKLQDDIAPEKNGTIKILVPSIPGEYTWNFEKVIHANTGDIIKEINKSKSFTVEESGKITLPKESNDAFVKPLRDTVPQMTEEEIIEHLVKRVLVQNDGSEGYRQWTERLTLYHNFKIAREVRDRVKDAAEAERLRLKKERKIKEDRLRDKIKRAPKHGDYRDNLNNNLNDLIKENIELNDFDKKTIPTTLSKNIDIELNQYVFQERYEDQKNTIPRYLNEKFIVTFTYDSKIDFRDNNTNNNAVNYAIRRMNKHKKWEKERDRWFDLLRQWVNEQKEENSKDDDISEDKDPYDIMAETIFAYWLSKGPQPFKAAPPVPPCNVPSPGSFIPVYYGNQNQLANNLRKSWNMGKRTSTQPGLQASSTAVASAVAASCAKHILQFKFIYVGQMIVGPTTIPMIGFVPTAF